MIACGIPDSTDRVDLQSDRVDFGGLIVAEESSGSGKPKLEEESKRLSEKYLEIMELAARQGPTSPAGVMPQVLLRPRFVDSVTTYGAYEDPI